MSVAEEVHTVELDDGQVVNVVRYDTGELVVEIVAPASYAIATFESLAVGSPDDAVERSTRLVLTPRDLS